MFGQPLKEKTSYSSRDAAARINIVNWITKGISIEIGITSFEPYRILRRPAPGLGIVVASAEPDELRMLIVQPTRKAERLETRIGVLKDISKLIIVNPLRDITSDGANDKSWATQVVGKNPICSTALYHVIRDVSA